MTTQLKNSSNKRKICVVAGGGDLPFRVISRLEELKLEFFVVSILGFGPNCYPEFEIGEIGGILDYIKSQNATEVLFCGNVKRPSFFSLKLDSLGKKWVIKLGVRIFLGDDALLKGVRVLLSEEGLKVISPQSVLKTLLTPNGVLTKNSPTELDLQDIARGIFVLNALSKADVGQALIVQEGVVLGIEAAEGTQKLIERCFALKLNSDKSGVLVKTSKINQDQSIDLPTIGKDTILQVEKSKLSGIALGAGKSQIIDFEETIELANKKDIFIIGI